METLEKEYKGGKRRKQETWQGRHCENMRNILRIGCYLIGELRKRREQDKIKQKEKKWNRN